MCSVSADLGPEPLSSRPPPSTLLVMAQSNPKTLNPELCLLHVSVEGLLTSESNMVHLGENSQFRASNEVKGNHLKVNETE